MVVNRPSSDPRDQAIGAALRDGAALARMVGTELRGSYWGNERQLYLRSLRSFVADLGGRLEETSGLDLMVDFEGRTIWIRFG